MSIDEFTKTFDGDVIRATDDVYGEIAAVSQHASVPDVIVRPRSANGVAQAIRHATHNGLELSVRCGGHGVTPHTDLDGVLIDLCLMNGVEILEDGRVRIGGGAIWGDVAKALEPHELVITAGDTKNVGVGGLTLGGGIGLFVRKWGLAIDNLVEAQVVTAKGDVLIANNETNADLFWGLRGGGGNFGIVTSFTFQAQSLNGVVAGMLVFDDDAFADVVKTWRDIMRAAPVELNGTLMTMPEMGPGIPATTSLFVVYAGDDVDAVVETVRPLLELDGFQRHDIARKSYCDVLFDGMPPPPDIRIATRNGLVKDLQDEAVDVLAELRTKYPMSITLLRWMQGAFNDVAKDATAFAWRDGEVMVMFAPFFPATEPITADERAAADWQRFEKYADGSYGNFLNESGPAWVIESIYSPETYGELRKLKSIYDPENLFHQNNNVVPA